MKNFQPDDELDFDLKRNLKLKIIRFSTRASLALAIALRFLLNAENVKAHTVQDEARHSFISFYQHRT